MIQFTDLQKDVCIEGLCVPGPARIIAAEPEGSDSYNIFYKDAAGQLGARLVYSSELAKMSVAAETSGWTFRGDGSKFRLALEAERIRLAHLFDPYMALSSSSVQPLPHQIAAVYEEMLPRLPLRFVLADDPGAGKTIMTGLLVKELMIRGALQRCLIVSPGSLAEQWREELAEKFGLQFALLSSDALYSAASGNPFKDNPLLIARLDVLTRNQGLQDMLKECRFDLIVCDEAHKMSASKSGRKVSKTRRYELGELLAGLTEHFLLLTATPHNGKEADFQLFMSLIDPDRFDVTTMRQVEPVDVSDVMRRLVKEELLRFDGTPLFPEREVHTLKYSLSPEEAELYRNVTDYVRSEFNRAERLAESKRNAIGFALTLLQRRLASSPEAIYQSLVRRKERLQERLEANRLGTDFDVPKSSLWRSDEDDFSSQEAEAQSDEIITGASAAATAAELEAEIATLGRLARQAAKLRASGRDVKWQQLQDLLNREVFPCKEDGHPEKLIIFTEHRDTIRYLEERIATVLGDRNAVVTIHGGLDRRARKYVEAEFKNNPDVQILLATDAAGEGINLQVAHFMVNYDLPWNPNRIEQRFGRIHRIGQEHVCHLWNLVAGDTREGQVFDLLFQKLDQQRRSLPGRVFDVLGKVEWEGGKSLRDLLITAVRSESSRTIDDVVAPSINATFDRLQKLMAEQALTDDFMDEQMVQNVREEMERAEARRLQPFYVQSFFLDAMRELGGRVVGRGRNCFEVVRLPRSMQQEASGPVAARYSSVCFDKESIAEGASETTELITPGSPLLDALLTGVTKRYEDVLASGAILVDESGKNNDMRLLIAVRDEITSAAKDAQGKRRLVSSELAFVELTEDGRAKNAGCAPYLDYRAVRPDEQKTAETLIADAAWLQGSAEKRANDYAADHIVPAHLEQVRLRTVARLDKVADKVQKRLAAEINQANKEALRFLSGRGAVSSNAASNAAQFRRRADDLRRRRDRRLRELEEQKDLSSTSRTVVSAAVVIPAGLLPAAESSLPPASAADVLARKEIEQAAMQAVMAAERSLGYEPRDVSSENLGYDIESRIPEDKRGEDGAMLRFIEVKGRAHGADVVSVSRNEITTGLNEPEQYILALVDVGQDQTTTTYLKRPFQSQPDFGVTSQNYRIPALRKTAQIVFERTDTR